MDIKFIKPLVTLGVPGVALGIFYLLLKSLNFEFSSVSSTWTAVIVILFLLIVGGVVLFALHRWSPNQFKDSAKEPSKKETKETEEHEKEFEFVVGEERITFQEKMTSLKKDVVKIFAHTYQLGVAAEYQWINHKYPNAERKMQYLSTLEMLTKDKMEKEIYFDISEFVHHGMGSSMKDSDSYMAEKLKSLYS
ncbi:hypothetical protein C0W42_16645 [Photobacterium kishitanii]|uniref:hypothetical protein n=1 Tax=Photobacterium kishitanii TaxID=318456 RepID=UPI000D15E509|nr:hypothetical protein [Photobacterium kishitanii]PSU87386.1 hypothetical protein C0W42_16645 [Photobacterium kishitanii]